MLLRDLGTAFRGEALSYKPYPCGRPLHAAIDAALAARARLEIARPDDIRSVTVEADPTGHEDQFCRGPAKHRPTQVVEAQFAQPFLIATALVHGKIGIAEVDGLGDVAVLAIADRIAGIAREGRPKGSLSITVQRTDGRSVTVETSDPTGSPEKPLTDVQLEGKFRDCARNALRPIPDASVDAALAAIGRLETLPDARELMTLFAGGSSDPLPGPDGHARYDRAGSPNWGLPRVCPRGCAIYLCLRSPEWAKLSRNQVPETRHDRRHVARRRASKAALDEPGDRRRDDRQRV